MNINFYVFPGTSQLNLSVGW